MPRVILTGNIRDSRNATARGYPGQWSLANRRRIGEQRSETRTRRNGGRRPVPLDVEGLDLRGEETGLVPSWLRARSASKSHGGRVRKRTDREAGKRAQSGGGGATGRRRASALSSSKWPNIARGSTVPLPSLPGQESEDCDRRQNSHGGTSVRFPRARNLSLARSRSKDVRPGTEVRAAEIRRRGDFEPRPADRE